MTANKKTLKPTKKNITTKSTNKNVKSAAKSKANTKPSLNSKTKKTVKTATPVKTVKSVKTAKPVKTVKSVNNTSKQSVKKALVEQKAKSQTAKSQKSGAPLPKATKKPVVVKETTKVIKGKSATPKKVAAKKPEENMVKKTLKKTIPSVVGKKIIANVASAAKTIAKPNFGVNDSQKKPNTKGFSKSELREFYNAMMSLAKRLSVQVDELHKQSLLRHDEVNQDEDGTDAFERVISLDRANADQSTIYQINNAIRAIQEGSYGLCDVCGGRIETTRLVALPFVKTCITCQSELEGSADKRKMFSDDLLG